MDSACGLWGEQTCTQDFGGKFERKRSLGRHISMQEVHLKMDFKALYWEVAEWLSLAQDRANLRLF